MKWPKWTLISILIISAFFVLFSQVYVFVQEDFWNEKNQLEQIAFTQSDLSRSNRVVMSYGEQSIGIVYGKNKLNQSVMVMIKDQQVIDTFLLSRIYQEVLLRKDVKRLYPNQKTIRIQPTIKNNKYAWEVYSVISTTSKPKHVYHYFDMKEGTYLDTYQLSITN
jgi:uncharacterized protein YpmB